MKKQKGFIGKTLRSNALVNGYVPIKAANGELAESGKAPVLKTGDV